MNSYFNEKKDFFKSQETFNYDFRIYMLNNLKNTIKKYEDEIFQALKLDLNKPDFESYTSEIGIVYEEINYTIKNLSKWMKAKKVRTPISIMPGSSYIYKVPKGVVLIISPWNYPFQLVFNPLIASIAAGNCAVVKPSNKSVHTSKIVSTIIDEVFPNNFVSVVNGPGSEVVDYLTDTYNFDHIFFTGSVEVGRHINTLAAAKFTSVTLELGGKSPAIVFDDADISNSAKSIIWGKFFNAGQTCVAPDYLLVDSKVKDKLVQEMISLIKTFYEGDLENNLAKIIDDRSFSRLKSLIEDNEIIYGGEILESSMQISPTLLYPKSLNSKIMTHEIFGPLLPIIEFNSLEEVYCIINRNPNPLALYLFTNNKDIEYSIISNIQFGGGCVNNTLNHFVNNNLPFGGVRESGIGRYHSQSGFDSFSNEKSIYKSGPFELNIKFPPYNKNKLNLVKKLMK